MAESVVSRTTFCVRENAVSLVDFFKFLFRRMIAGITIRVILQGKFSISALQLLLCGGTADAENLIIISFAHLLPFTIIYADANFSQLSSAAIPCSYQMIIVLN